MKSHHQQLDDFAADDTNEGTTLFRLLREAWVFSEEEPPGRMPLDPEEFVS